MDLEKYTNGILMKFREQKIRIINTLDKDVGLKNNFKRLECSGKYKEI